MNISKTIMISFVTGLTFSNGLFASKLSQIGPKTVTINIPRSTSHSMIATLTAQVNEHIQQLNTSIAQKEQSPWASTTTENNAVVNLRNFIANPTLHITVSAVGTSGTKEIIASFPLTKQGAKIPVAIPGTINGPKGKEKTKIIEFMISPVQSVNTVKNMPTPVIVQGHPWPKVANNQLLTISNSNTANKKYKMTE